MRDKIVLFAMIRLLILQNTFHLLCVSKCIAKYPLLHINVINYTEYFTIIASLGIDLFKAEKFWPRLWTHNQKITVAARAIAERKTLGLLS